HHQDASLPSSCVLIASKFLPNLPEKFKKVLEVISERDKTGKVTDYKLLSEFLERIVLQIFQNSEYDVLFTAIKQVIENYSKIEKVLKDVQIVGIKDIKVAYTKLSPKEFPSLAKEIFEHYKTDLLICKNQFNENHTSIIKNSSSPFYNDIDLEKLDKIVFIHNTKFMCVIDVNIDYIDFKEIEKII
ncbi:MAG: hypothetical protein ACK4F0_08660, partial [Candidatus Ratteibacteria bacterium]